MSAPPLRWIHSLHDLLYTLSYPHPTAKDIEEKSNGFNIPNVILLGAGQVGKSTICAQIRYILSDEEKRNMMLAKHSGSSFMKHVWYMMRELIHAVMVTRGHSALTETTASVAHKVRSTHIGSTNCLEFKEELKMLWADPVIQSAFLNLKPLTVSPNASHFMDKIDDFAEDHYAPTFEDIFRLKDSENDYGDELVHYVNGTTFHLKEIWYALRRYRNAHTVVFVVALNHFDRALEFEHRINALRESLHLFEETMKKEKSKHSRIVLLFTFKDVFEDQIEIQRKSLSECFDDFRFQNTDPKMIRPHIMAIAQSFLMEIADSNGYEVYDTLIVLCALFYGDEVNFAMNFIIDKFKEKIPSEKEEYVSIHSICALDTEEVKEVFDEITSEFSSEEDHLEELRRRRRFKVEEMKSEGIKEMKVTFPLVIMALIVMIVPSRALCYLALTASICVLIAFMGWFGLNHYGYKLPASVSFVRSSKYLSPYLLFILLFQPLLTLVIWAGNVEANDIGPEHQSNAEWIVYIVFPIGVFTLYFVVFLFHPFYWFWHQSWALLWSGIILIVSGLVMNNNATSARCIIGICLIMFSVINPFVAFYYLKCIQKVIGNASKYIPVCD